MVAEEEALRVRRALVALAIGASLPVGVGPLGVGPACAGDAATDAAPAAVAAVHVVFPGDREVARCVPIAPGETTGIEALQATGLPLVTEQFAGSGALVCAIRGVGSAFPKEACVPPCPNGRCMFWAYLTRSAGEPWVFSSVGASSRTLGPGDEDAWVFGAHTTSSVDRIPPMRERVCAAGVAPPREPLMGGGFPLVGIAPFAAAGAFGVAAMRRMRRRRDV